MLAHGGVDALDPQGAEVTLLLLAADVIVLQRLINRGIGRGDVVLAAAAHALGLLEDLLAAGVGRSGKGGRASGLYFPALRPPALERPGFGFGTGCPFCEVGG